MTGAEVRKFREEHGLSKTELGVIIGCTGESIIYFEKGKTKYSRIPKVVKELIGSEELLSEKMTIVEIRRRGIDIKRKHKDAGYIPGGKSFEEYYNAKLLNFSRGADKLGISYGNYMAMRRAKNDSRTARNY